MSPVLRSWLPIAFIATVLCGLIYVAVLQVIRLSANDIIVQMAEDAASGLSQGEPPQSVVPDDVVDIAKSIAPYVVIFDPLGKPIASSGDVNGRMPTLPDGILSSARENGGNRTMWEPQPGVRQAIVVVPSHGLDGGFVMAGRSMRELEKQQMWLMQVVAVAWLLALAGSFFLIGVSKRPQ